MMSYVPRGSILSMFQIKWERNRRLVNSKERGYNPVLLLGK